MTRLLIPLFALASLSASVSAEDIDAVAAGKAAFETYGCMVCHAVDRDKAEPITGPNLYGLFINEARARAVADPNSGETRAVKADKTYYLNSVRESWDALAIGESGAFEGKPFPKIMPMYSKEVIPDAAVEHIWHYLRSRADEGQAGPAVVKVPRPPAPDAKDPLAIPHEILVEGRTRVFRAPLRGSSGRAIHVGLDKGMNYTFDPRVLSVRNIWAGGFLNLTSERTGRGKPGSTRGRGHRVMLESDGILRPLLPSGEPVDFEFKEPDVLDHKAIERWLWDERNFLELLRKADAEFKGYAITDAEPTFTYRVGRNEISMQVALVDGPKLGISIQGTLKEPQKFKVGAAGLTDVTVDAGTLKDGIWTLDAGEKVTGTFCARLPGGPVALPGIGREENWDPQPLVTNTRKIGRERLETMPGYRYENWEAPKDLYGREQLFEPTGMAVAKDGTLVLSTRSAGIWRLRDNEWSLFAEGTYECLGVVIEDDRGDRIVVMQKPEMTRISDTDGDGRADRFDTMCDDYGFHGNYHEYAHGPVRDKAGAYYFTLNLSHGGNERTSWRAGGPFMGSMGGFRGWACRVTPQGEFDPFAFGLRSPAGLGVAPDGRIWYAENQGEYVGSSKVVPLEVGRFYGHLSGLVSLPINVNPDSPELAWDNWKDKLRKGAVWLPHGKVANSPGHMTWDQTGGKFGPFGGHMFLGDQTMSNLFRVVPEQVKDIDQGCVIGFARFTASGVMRPVFLPDGSLLLGQTGRGWGAWGGQQAALQRIIWDGETVPADIHRISSDAKGFRLHFTRPLARGALSTDHFKIESWFYTNTGRYGSPEHDKREDALHSVSVSEDRKSALLALHEFGGGEKLWIDRIYHIQVPDTAAMFGESVPAKKGLRGYFTLRVLR